MDQYTALLKADDVKTFPSLNMPPAKKSQYQKNKNNKNALHIDENILFPGLLKTQKQNILKIKESQKVADSGIFIGFNSTHLKFDVTTGKSRSFYPSSNSNNDNNNNNLDSSQELLTTKKSLTQINLSTATTTNNNNNQPSNTERSNASSNKPSKLDPTIEELRNYVELMDKYSLHNFTIYDGKVLKETPEFQSFKRTFQNRWGAITFIIGELERFLHRHKIKLAIINGPYIFELAKLNLAVVTREEMYESIINIEQIQMQIEGEAKAKDFALAAIKTQTIIRAFLAKKNVKRMLKQKRSAVKIQSIARRMIARIKLKMIYAKANLAEDRRSKANRQKLETWWSANSGLQEEQAEIRSRTILYIPSVSIAEYLRLNYENFSTMQNAHMSVLYQLADPGVTLLYVTPKHLSGSELTYHEKMLSLMGISLLPKRLYFITPEFAEKLPPHCTVAFSLWCSNVALRRIRSIVRRSPVAMLVPATISWTEKRLANYLDLPLLSGEPSVCESICSRSFLKKLFTDVSVSIPIGAHDIFSVDDLLVALSRLVASNISIKRWLIRLNSDWNNESTTYLDMDKIPLITNLRTEQNQMAGSNNNGGSWYSRQVQMAVRKRVLAVLKDDLTFRMKWSRKDIYLDWDYYTRLLRQFGAVIEADPIERLGHVDGLCFVDPFGNVDFCSGVELYVDDNYQTQGYNFPQMVTPAVALEGATKAVATHLFQKYKIIGYITVKFQSFWDALDNVPRLWGVGLQLGMGPVFGAIGSAGLLTGFPHSFLPLCLMADVAPDRFFTYVPIAIHDPLKTSTDESFFKLCKMRGIAFDIKHKQGSLFFVVDSVVGGIVSLLCIGSTRRKSIELAIHALTFVSQQFGKDHTKDIKKCENLTFTLLNMRHALKFDKNVN